MQRCCARCGEEKPQDRFTFVERTGRWSQNCVDCKPRYSRQRKHRYSCARAFIKDKLYNIRRYKVEIDIEYMLQLLEEQGGKCAITGMTMTIDPDDSYANMSIDRIDSNGDYSPGNVRLICSAVNMMRGRMDDERLKFWCRAIVDAG